MLDLSGCDLEHDPEAVTAQRRPVVVPVRFAAKPGTLTTLEGPVEYQAGAAICTGVDGERWPVTVPRFFDLYEAVSGTRVGEDGLYRKRPLRVRAKRVMGQTFTVNVGFKEMAINGKPGDWLVQHSPGKRAIVGNEVFRRTYEVLG